jgi:GTP pyrophosphokinase
MSLELGRLGLDLEDAEILAGFARFRNIDALYREIGRMSDAKARNYIRQGLTNFSNVEFRRHLAGAETVHVRSVVVDVVDVGPVAAIACGVCNPSVDDDLYGLYDESGVFVVHRPDCALWIEATSRDSRGARAIWADAQRLTIAIEVVGINRIGLLSDITQTLKNMKIEIRRNTSAMEGESTVHFYFLIWVTNLPQLSGILDRIETIPGVVRVGRSNGLLGSDLVDHDER